MRPEEEVKVLDYIDQRVYEYLGLRRTNPAYQTKQNKKTVVLDALDYYGVKYTQDDMDYLMDYINSL